LEEGIKKGERVLYQATVLPAEKHCFFASDGGVSGGKYASLNTNLSSQDNHDNILHNFTIIAGHFGLNPDDMFTIRQSTSNTAVLAEKPSWFELAADGIVTTTPNLLLGIKTADCAPVLLADYAHGVIGAAHAGWRGAYRGIVENVVDLMLQAGAKRENICAAIGPCLQKESFVVKDDMRQVFIDLQADNARYFSADNKAQLHFDLSAYVADKLFSLGIKKVENSAIDTYPVANGYFSYRRNTHLHLIDKEKDYPTQYSCIRL